MMLLQRMGWKAGEGLGKNNEGAKEPLMLDFKTDRRGKKIHLMLPYMNPFRAIVFEKQVVIVI